MLLSNGILTKYYHRRNDTSNITDSQFQHSADLNYIQLLQALLEFSKGNE